MLKLQQFNILSLTYERLENCNFNLNIDLNEAILNDEIIQLADNEVLRAIRRITHHPYDAQKFRNLWKSRDIVIKQKSGAENKRLVKELTSAIEQMLYIPEYVCVYTEKKAKYGKIGKNGFVINGVKYRRLLCSAGQARTNRTMFVSDNIYKELNKILKNGCHDVKIELAKWNAYYALSSSATFRVSTPRVCVVKDCEVERLTKVEWVTEYPSNEQEDDIDTREIPLKFNLFDGMGLISPSKAQEWAYELELDYLPSAYIIRSAFVKGLVATFDFHKFAKKLEEQNGYIPMIKDIYGKEYNPYEIDIVLSESQFKLWRGYTSWEEYCECLKKSGIHWGISKVTPKIEKDFIRTNYQFLQVLNLSDEDIQGLCEPTIEWLKGIKGGDINQMILYLLGKSVKEQDSEKLWQHIQDHFVRALLLDNRLIADPYIQSRIVNSLNKRIEESYYGKLLIAGNYEIMVSDPYAFCEHMFGLEVKGLLKAQEHYSHYWNDRKIKQVAGMRAPLTWRSEVNLLNLKQNEETEEWYKYQTNTIIYNVFGVDTMLHAGSD